MTGLERNADVVSMASYAPLFARADGWQWTPDLIWFDNLHAYGTPNYYVQKLFSNNKGTDVVPALSNGKPLAGQDSLYASAVIDKKTNEVIVKIVNGSTTDRSTNLVIEGVKKILPPVLVTTLTGQNADQENSFETPLAVSPETGILTGGGRDLNIFVKANSLTVIRVAMQ